MFNFIKFKRKTPIAFDTDLAHTFGFDTEDFHANRTFALSEQQQQYLRWELLGYSLSVLIVCGMTLLIAGGIMFVIATFTEWAILAPLWIIGIIFIFSIIWLRKALAIWSDMRNKRVVDIMGSVTWGQSPMSPYIKIEGKRYPVTKDQMYAFKEPWQHIIYIAPASKIVLSAKILDDRQKVPAPPQAIKKKETIFDIRDSLTETPKKGWRNR